MAEEQGTPGTAKSRTGGARRSSRAAAEPARTESAQAEPPQTEPPPETGDPLQEIRDRYRRIAADLRVATAQAPDPDRKLWCLPKVSCSALQPETAGLAAAVTANEAVCKSG